MELVRDERRREPRIPVRLEALVAIDGANHRRCWIHDINAYGARVDVGGQIAEDSFYLVELTSARAYLVRVAWRQPPLIGTRFQSTFSLNDKASPKWLAALRRDALRTGGAARGIRLAWSAPTDG
jgi:hypothetical protein